MSKKKQTTYKEQLCLEKSMCELFIETFKARIRMLNELSISCDCYAMELIILKTQVALIDKILERGGGGD